MGLPCGHDEHVQGERVADVAGPVIGDYRAEEVIGVGASATVWRGSHRRTGQVVALKVFTDPDPVRARDQAEREAAIGALVDHPHLLPVLGLTEGADCIAMVTPLADGGSVADRLETGPLGDAAVRRLLTGVAGALAAAHALHLVHGDLSAGNVLYDESGEVLLADLGAMRAAAEVSRPVVATPEAVAPEVARGAAPSAPADMFALGAVALQARTGRSAWPADDLHDVVIQATAGQWPAVQPEDGIDPELAAMITALLDPDPRARPTAVAVVMGLGRSGGGRGRGARSRERDDEGESQRGDPEGGAHRPGSRAARRSAVRARALTRLRADRPVMPPEPVRRWERVRARVARPRRDDGPVRWPGAGPEHERGRPSGVVRTVAVALLVAGIATGAVLAGLWWADAGRVTPTEIAAVPADSGAGGSAPVPGLTSVLPNDLVSGDGGPSGAVPDGAVPSGLPADQGGKDEQTVPVRADWAAVLTDLDQRRSVAFSAGDLAALASVYHPDAAELRADREQLAGLTRQGLTVDGAAHLIAAVEVLDDDGEVVVLAVTDSQPSVVVRDVSGTEVARTRPRDSEQRVVRLRPIAGEYRIAGIELTQA